MAVTGGTGFVGRRFIEDAARKGYRIRLLARNPASLPGLDSHPFDLEAPDPLAPEVLRGCAAVVHMAAYIPKEHSNPAEAELCWKVNALGTLRLINAMEQAGVGHLVQITSANAYSPEVLHPSETAPMFPTDRVYYLSSKLAQEIYANYRCAAAGIVLSTLRASSVYGAEQTIGAVYAIAKRLLTGEKVALESCGSFGADFLYLDDLSSALLLMLAKQTPGPYNVGSGSRSTIAEIATQIGAVIGSAPSDIRLEGKPKVQPYGFPSLDISKIVALGHRPTPLQEGLELTIRQLKQFEYSSRN